MTKQPMAIQLLFKNMVDFECYAESVPDFTAKYNHNMTISYGPENLTGKPVKYPGYGDCVDTYMLRKYGKWWNESENAQKHYMSQDIEEIQSQDYVTLKFEDAVIPKAIVIYETYNPGAVVRIWGRHTGENWIILWEGKPEICPQTSRNFCPPIREITDLINEVRLDLNCSLLNYQAALDAVLLAGKQPASELQRKLISSRLLEAPVEQAISVEEESSSEIDCTENVFATLPYDVIVHTFKYLDLKTLCRCAQVSKLWLAATLDPRVYCHLSLKRYWHKIDDTLLQTFTERCRTLRKLDLSWCGNDGRICEDVFTEFINTSCKYLTHLSLRHCKFMTNACVASIARCKDLVEIRLHDCDLGQQSEQFRDLAALNKLVTLDLYSSSISDNDLIHILKHTPNLKHINIDMCSNLKRLDIITETVSYFNQNLVTWSSWKIERMTAFGVKSLSKCHRLRELDLGWCFISTEPEESLEHIAQCKDLRRLVISRWRGMCDHILLPIIRSCKQLTQLDLLGTNITGGICDVAMGALPKLQLLDISYCDTIPPEEVAEMRMKYPHVNIHHSLENNN